MPSPTLSPPKGNPGARYGLEPSSAAVLQLTRIVARQDSDLDEIAKIITKDKALSARLLRLANPRAESEDDYAFTTVDEALLRTGLAPVMLLAMVDPLTRAVVKAFGMFQAPLTPGHRLSTDAFGASHVAASVEFVGKAAGIITIRLTSPIARDIAAKIIGVTPEELADQAEINDVIGELANMVAGNLKSNLCDAGFPCTLSIPEVESTNDFKLKKTAGGVSDRLGFQAPNFETFVCGEADGAVMNCGRDAARDADWTRPGWLTRPICARASSRHRPRPRCRRRSR
jgi:CheY-specific phosphatase CheX